MQPSIALGLGLILLTSDPEHFGPHVHAGGAPVVLAANQPTNLTPTLVGALAGLVAALIIQVVVVPWAQARSKRRERWQTALIEYEVEVMDFYRVIHRYETRMSSVLIHHEQIVAAGPPQSLQEWEPLELIMKRDNEWLATRDTEIDESLRRMSPLHGRVRTLLSDEDRYVLDDLLRDLIDATYHIHVAQFVDPDSASPDHERLRALITSAKEAQRRLHDFIFPMAQTLTAPRQLRDALRRRTRRITRWPRSRILELKAWVARRLDARASDD